MTLLLARVRTKKLIHRNIPAPPYLHSVDRVHIVDHVEMTVVLKLVPGPQLVASHAPGGHDRFGGGAGSHDRRVRRLAVRLRPVRPELLLPRKRLEA